MELILSLLLMFVVLSVPTGAKEGVAGGGRGRRRHHRGGAIRRAGGGGGRPEHLWVYLTAPVLGAAGGVLACGCIQRPGCCGRAGAEGCG